MGLSVYPCVPSVLLQTSGVEDWRAQLLDAVRRVFLSERDVLKSALYRQLDALDTSDAIVHLNQLERRLAEQVSQATSVTSGLEGEQEAGEHGVVSFTVFKD